MEGWWRWALVSLDGVAPSWIVGVSASVNLPLHHKVHFSGTDSPGWSRKKAIKRLWCGVGIVQTDNHASASSLNFFTGQMLFLMLNQQCLGTDGN